MDCSIVANNVDVVVVVVVCVCVGVGYGRAIRGVIELRSFFELLRESESGGIGEKRK